MSEQEKFSFNCLITIQPFISEQHLKVRESIVCIQIIASILQQSLKATTDHVTIILKCLKLKLRDEKYDLMQQFHYLNNRSKLWGEEDYNKLLKNFIDSDPHSVIQWVYDHQRVDIIQQFIYLINIVQLIIQKIGQIGVEKSNNWIEDLFDGTISYNLIKEMLAKNLKLKNRKTVLQNLLLTNNKPDLSQLNPEQIEQLRLEREARCLEEDAHTLKNQIQFYDTRNSALQQLVLNKQNEIMKLKGQNQQLQDKKRQLLENNIISRENQIKINDVEGMVNRNLQFQQINHVEQERSIEQMVADGEEELLLSDIVQNNQNLQQQQNNVDYGGQIQLKIENNTVNEQKQIFAEETIQLQENIYKSKVGGISQKVDKKITNPDKNILAENQENEIYSGEKGFMDKEQLSKEQQQPNLEVNNDLTNENQENKERQYKLNIQNRQIIKIYKIKPLRRPSKLPIKDSPVKINLSKRVSLYEQTLIGLKDKNKQN